jgi:hypothetical protein
MTRLSDPGRMWSTYGAAMSGEPEIGPEISAHARRRMILRDVSTAQVNAVIVLCSRPRDQGDGTLLYRAFVDNRNLGVVRALDGTIVTVLDFDRSG